MKIRHLAGGCVILMVASGREILKADLPHVHEESPSETQLYGSPSVELSASGTAAVVMHRVPFTDHPWNTKDYDRR